MSHPLAGRVALITGVSRRIGIGYAVARRLLESGADLFIQHYSPFDAAQPWGADDVNALIADLREIGPRVEHTTADFSDQDAPQQVVSAAVDAFGHVDILVANHAYSVDYDLENVTAEALDKHLTVNVRGTVLLVKHFAEQHNGQPGGRVVMMTSGQHLHPMADNIAYIASKGAIHQLTLSLSAHFIRRGITVNTINPGATDTGYADDALRAAIIAESPQGRWGEPDDAARLIAWLATDDARWITGQVIDSTGGGL